MIAVFRFPDPLYPIADAGSCADVVALAEAILSAGARLLQLRAKGCSTRAVIDLARAVKARTDRAGAVLIVNDRADIAQLVDAAGVHLGQDDLPPTAARAMLGAAKIIGTSTHTPQQADAALRAGAIDYLAYGPIFATHSKADPDPVQGLDALAAVRRRCPLPLVAIGGITAANARAVRTAGADAVAVIAAIAKADDPAVATRQLLAAARSA
ncbi:MAG: thiamine phosphate synthase [Candidatus Binatia bacterium]